MRSGGRQGGGEGLAGGGRSPPSVPPSLLPALMGGGDTHGGPARDTGLLGALRPRAPPGGVWCRDLALLEAAWA